MFKPDKVYILEQNNYRELSYEEFCYNKSIDKSYDDRWFISLHGMLMEVSRDNYIDFYREKRRQKYIYERSVKNKDISYDMLTTKEQNGEEILIDSAPDVSKKVEDKMLLERLKESILLLSKDEQMLIRKHYFQGIPEIKLAKMYGISQQGISKRLIKIREKLRKMMED